jgi:hypothetical protein
VCGPSFFALLQLITAMAAEFAAILYGGATAIAKHTVS